MPFLQELKRRNVVRAAVAYLAGAWLLLQVANTVLPALELPEWIMPALIYTAVLGFPLALILAWLYEWTPEGLKPTAEADSVPAASRTSRRKFDLAVIGVLGLAVVFLVVDNYVLTEGRDRPPTAPRLVPLTFDGGEKERPRLSPDGRMVAYAWDGPNRDNVDVYVRVIGRDTAPIRVTSDATPEFRPAWSPDGTQLTFVRFENGVVSLYVAPALGGQAKKVTDFLSGAGLNPAAGLGPATWSPNGPFLVYNERPSGNAAPSHIVELDMNTGLKRALSDPDVSIGARGDFGPVFSPSGDRLAFTRGQSSNGNNDIWVMDAEGGNEEQITTDRWQNLHSLSWTPDGEELLFTAGANNQRSYIVRLDDRISRPLPGLGEDDIFANAAAQRLVFVQLDVDRLRMWATPGRLAADRGAAPRDLAREGFKIDFSPDGSQIAWQSQRTGRHQIWIADADGARGRALTEQKVDAYNPQWSLDGREIAFYSGDAGNFDIYVVDVDTGRVRALTTDMADDRYPTFSHDGRSIYFSSKRSGTSEIYKMPAEGGDAVPITRGGGTIAFESPDGQYLYYEYLDTGNGFTTGTNAVLRVRSDGSEAPIEVLPGWPRLENSWVLGDEGIYYLQNGSIRYRAFGSGEDVEIVSISGVSQYPGVSPDEETVFFSRAARRGSELWLLEGFR
jgi:Tol biopolymer transport system component